MKERPILFNTEMVKAVLDGRKTQTRRVIKFDKLSNIKKGRLFYSKLCDSWVIEDKGENPEATVTVVKCPYGKTGDRLWVMETFKVGAWRDDGRIAIDYKASPELKNTPWVTIPDDDLGEKFEGLWIKISDELEKKGVKYDYNGQYKWEPGNSPLSWKPPIHMPRWASRITLEITNVRVERVQDISKEDAIAEGVTRLNCGDFGMETYFSAFKNLWNSINQKYGYGWVLNPWVWVIEFKEVK